MGSRGAGHEGVRRVQGLSLATERALIPACADPVVVADPLDLSGDPTGRIGFPTSSFARGGRLSALGHRLGSSHLPHPCGCRNLIAPLRVVLRRCDAGRPL